MRSILFATAFAVASIPLAHAATDRFHATLSTGAEVPPHDTRGAGVADATLDTVTHVLTYTITYKDLTGPAMMAHLHGPAAAGANAGVLAPIAGPLDSPIKGSTTLTEAQQEDLLAGKTYFNIHTDANKGGEIRGQVEAAK